MKLKFKYKLNKGDIFDLTLWYFKRKWSNWLFIFLSILIIILNYYLAYLKRNYDENIFSLFLPTFLMIFMWSLIIFITWRGINNSYKSNKGIQEEFEMSFNEKHIKHKSKSIESVFAWKILYQIVESKNHFYLFTSKLQAIPLPKRVFNNDKDYIEFRKFLFKISRKFKIKSKGLH